MVGLCLLYSIYISTRLSAVFNSDYSQAARMANIPVFSNVVAVGHFGMPPCNSCFDRTSHDDIIILMSFLGGQWQ